VNYDCTYLSLGAGVQSSALAAMCATGYRDCPPVDVAIFADVGDEPQAVYAHLWRLVEWLDKHGMRVDVVSNGSVSGGRLDGFSIPAFTDGGGMLPRQCTIEHKIVPIHRHVRTLLGYQPRQWIRHTVRALHGISIEEIYRMKPARKKWLTIEYPLIDRNIARAQCAEIFRELTGLPPAPRSACVFCPYHSDAEWKRLKETDPEGWGRAVAHDDGLRNRIRKSGDRPLYVHRSRQPLREVEFKDEDQLYFNNECEGMCGV
jgi:hypothetical protein